MSHIVRVEVQVRDPIAVAAACRRLQLAPPQQRSTTLYQTAVAGLCVQLPGWHFPIVCHPESGQVEFDNYNGCWGEQKELDRFLQAYAVEKAKLEARRQGHTVFEQPLTDGSIKLTVQVAGGAA